MKNKSSSLLPLGDLVRNVTAVETDPLENGLERYIGLEHIEPENLHIKSWGNIADGTSFTRKFTKGQTLFGKRRAYQRKVAFAEWDGLCSSDILVLEPQDDRLLPELLPFICQTEGFYQHALGTSAGSLSPRTKWKHLAEYKIPIPPLDEQRRIAEILWAADETLENYKIALKTVSKTKETLITDFLDNIPQTVEVAFYPISKFEGEKGPILKTGPFGSSLKSEYFSKSGIPVLNISSVGEIGIDEEGLFFLPQDYAKKFKAYEVIENDIVFSRVAEVGRCLLIPKECEGWIISSNIIRIRLNELKVMPLYFLYLLKFSRNIQMCIKRHKAHRKTVQGAHQYGPCRTPFRREAAHF